MVFPVPYWLRAILFPVQLSFGQVCWQTLGHVVCGSFHAPGHFDGLVQSPVHVFFLWKKYRLSKKKRYVTLMIKQKILHEEICNIFEQLSDMDVERWHLSPCSLSSLASCWQTLRTPSQETGCVGSTRRWVAVPCPTGWIFSCDGSVSRVEAPLL